MLTLSVGIGSVRNGPVTVTSVAQLDQALVRELAEGLADRLARRADELGQRSAAK
jgi:hypothetical protein